MKQGRYSIYLERVSNEIFVSEEGYQRILEIARLMRVCHKCEQYYSDSSPNVAGNLCLSCFLRQSSGLTFQGPLENPENTSYLFLDHRGYVYTTLAGPGMSERAEEDVSRTIQYWEFPLPTQARKSGQMIKLRDDCYWHIYGDLCSEVVVLRHWIYKELDIAFIVHRNGKAVQIDRHRELHRRLLAGARAELEATRDSDGHYHPKDGSSPTWIDESDIYGVIAERLSAELHKELEG